MAEEFFPDQLHLGRQPGGIILGVRPVRMRSVDHEDPVLVPKGEAANVCCGFLLVLLYDKKADNSGRRDIDCSRLLGRDRA